MSRQRQIAAGATTIAFLTATASLAHASMTFADGRTLSSIPTRSCKVRGG